MEQLRSGGGRGSKLKVASLVLSGFALLLVSVTFAFITLKDPARLKVRAVGIAIEYEAKEKAPR